MWLLTDSSSIFKPYTNILRCLTVYSGNNLAPSFGVHENIILVELRLIKMSFFLPLALHRWYSLKTTLTYNANTLSPHGNFAQDIPTCSLDICEESLGSRQATAREKDMEGEEQGEDDFRANQMRRTWESTNKVQSV